MSSEPEVIEWTLNAFNHKVQELLTLEEKVNNNCVFEADENAMNVVRWLCGVKDMPPDSDAVFAFELTKDILGIGKAIESATRKEGKPRLWVDREEEGEKRIIIRQSVAANHLTDILTYVAAFAAFHWLCEKLRYREGFPNGWESCRAILKDMGDMEVFERQAAHLAQQQTNQ